MPRLLLFTFFRLSVVLAAYLPFCLSLLIISPFQFAQAGEVDLKSFSAGTLGQHVEYFQEVDSALSVQQAQLLFAQGQGVESHRDSLSLGIGVKPVWLRVAINNNTGKVRTYRFAIETPWLDHIDTWLFRGGELIRHVEGGDAIPFEQRPMPYRHFAFEKGFQPGITEIVIRVESLGPMAIPIRFSPKTDAINRDISAAYQYGVLYGAMSALAIYNLVLFAFIRQREYGLYALYLLGFVLNSLSYTGQLHTVITADFGKYFQDWLDIFLMITYSVAGLHFARALLDTKSYAPKLDNAVKLITFIIPVGMLIGFVFNQLVVAISLAFILNCGFVTLFIAMGYYAVRAQKALANIFLLSSVTAAICITISTLAVAGFLVPYNDYTFKAIEVGMTFEAILLAVILAKQFRMAKAEKLLAESYARTDALTLLNNRRGFQESTQPIWMNILRKKRDTSIVLFDLDDFKKVNDSYGHSAGDLVLKKVAEVINYTKRESDISGRWGGEEFILMLPETSIYKAAAQAERLRSAIENIQLALNDRVITLSASFGVAGSMNHEIAGQQLSEYTLEVMINDADAALYLAKEQGKNQVQVSDK